MPFRRGKSGYSDDLERAPLSAADEYGDELPSLPPYSDNPNKLNGRDGSDGASTNEVNANASSISIVRGVAAEDSEEESSHFLRQGAYNTPSKSKARRATRYRGNLVCAWLTCQCVQCCSDDTRYSRVISNSNERKESPCRRSAMMLFYIFLLAVIMACATLIGYIVAQDGNPFSGAASNNRLDGPLPPPPANLHDTCNDWITVEGRAECQKLCDVAKCCSLSESDSGSCGKSQATYCATYRAACMALELSTPEGDASGSSGGGGPGLKSGELLESSTKLTAPKPSYLDDICGIESLKTPNGFDQCSSVCRPSRCCHPEYSCEVTDDRFCVAYENPCANVAETWRGSGHATGNSDTDNNSVASLVMAKCNSASINPPDECIEACHPGACCYVSDGYPPIERLFEDHYGAAMSPMKGIDPCSSKVGFCQQFGSCEHLNHLKDSSGWHNDEVTYELDLSSVCMPEYVSKHGALECSNVCQPAHCCFSGEFTCDDANVGNINCEDYSQCGLLYPKATDEISTKKLFLLAKQIDEKCSEEYLSSANGRSECQNLCKDKLCCFEDGEYGCAGDPGQNCLVYAGCDTLVDTPLSFVNKLIEPPPKQESKPGDAEQAISVDEFVEQLDATCSDESLETLEGIQKCHNKCQTHLCCFTTDSALVGNDCSKVHPVACDAYKPCQRLVKPTTKPKDDITDHNSSEKINSVSIASICEYPDNDKPKVVDEWIKDCHAICAPRLCCLSDPSLDSNCRDTVGDEECDVYSPCQVLLGDLAQQSSEGQPVDASRTIESVCNEKTANDSDLYDQCEDMCSQRSCCFEDEPSISCYNMEKGWCDEFSACDYVDYEFTIFAPASLVVSGTQTPTPPPSTPQNIDEENYKSLCSLEKIDDHRETCRDLCDEYECCFNSENSCYETNRQDCDHHYDCEVFFGEEANVDATTSSTVSSTEQSPISAGDASKSAELDASNMEESVEPPPEVDFSAIDQKCERHYLLSFGSEECEFLCDQFGCCFDDDDGCIDGSVKGMCPQAHKRCKNIFVPDSEDLKILLSCKEEALEKSVHPCSDKCDPMECCFADDGNPHGIEPCPSNVADKCEDYTACSFYFESYKEYDVDDQHNESSTASTSAPSKASFQDLCSPSTIGLNWQKCQEQCQGFECCFSLENNCYEAQSLECQEYDICSEFYDNETAPASLSGGPMLNSMKTKCSLANMDKNLDECGSWCTPYECCFYYSNSCYDSNADDCNEHEICSTVFDRLRKKGATQTSSSSVPSSQLSDNELMILARACNDEKVSEDDSECRMLCKGAECCFASKKCNEMDAFCKDYDVCQRVFDS